MLQHKSVTLTITTCKRPQYFFRTIRAFLDNCADYNLISRVIVSDDNSPQEERDEMVKKYPQFEYVWRDCGHPKSLDMLFKMVDTNYFFHLEDDRPLVKRVNLIDVCINILEEAELDSYIPGLRTGHETNDKNYLRYNESIFSYYIHKFREDGNFSSPKQFGNTSWPGFYLAPGMHRTKSVQSIPYRAVPQHERSFALQYQKAGYKVGFNCGEKLFDHLTGTSAYKHITHAPR